MNKLALVCAAFCSSQLVCAQDDNGESVKETEMLRHRIDITGVFVDGAANESLSGLFAYAYSVTDNSNLTLTVPYLDPELDKGGDSGFGDVVAAYSIVPSMTISVNPWVPRTIGSGLAVLMPTGDVSEGRSLDSWVLYPFLGLVQPVSERFFIAPQIGYVYSLDSTVAETDLRLVTAELGFSYVAFNGFWTSYFSQFVRDLETDDWADNHRISIGKKLSRTFGVSLDYIYLERFNFGSDVPAEEGFDEQFEVNIHFTF
jgi:hypothetical protein